MLLLVHAWNSLRTFPVGSLVIGSLSLGWRSWVRQVHVLFSVVCCKYVHEVSYYFVLSYCSTDRDTQPLTIRHFVELCTWYQMYEPTFRSCIFSHQPGLHRRKVSTLAFLISTFLCGKGSTVPRLRRLSFVEFSIFALSTPRKGGSK